MNSNSFKRYGYQLIDWAIQYMSSLRERYPLPDVEPGWLRNICPQEAPNKAETFDDICGDIESVVLDGMVHWQHSQFFSYFPAGNSWASIMGDIFSNATGVNGITWGSCPVLTELELIVSDWCCKFLNLPNFFLSRYSCSESEGIGIIQQCASESIFYSMVWAREDAIRKLRSKFPNKPRGVLCNMLVAYCNSECHPCVEKAAYMGLVRLRKLLPDNDGVIRYLNLRNAIVEDIGKGLIPFFHTAVIGSTGVTAVDDLMEVGPICEEYGIWLHCDAAYAGSCFSCPEMNYLLQGFQYLWSININTNKWMMCNFEASLHWVRYSSKAIDPMAGWDNQMYQAPYFPDYNHYAIQSSRRFRAVKLWFVIRNYGVEGIRRYIRNHVNLAKLFEKFVRLDERFEICGTTRFGLVPSHFQDKVVLRLVLCSERANERDIDEAWRLIDLFASVLIRQYELDMGDNPAMKSLYAKQRRHDERNLHKRDTKLRDDEESASKILSSLRTKRISKVHGILQIQEAKQTSGTNTEKADMFNQYDAILLERPESVESIQLVVPKHVPSMLHWDLLQSTMTNVKKRNSDFQNQKKEMS